MNSLAIWRNKHLQSFQRPQIAISIWASAIFLSLKIYSCLSTPNCTRNHAITYKNNTAGNLAFGGGNRRGRIKLTINFTRVTKVASYY